VEKVIDTDFETKDGQMIAKDITRKILDRKLFRFINTPRFLTRVRNTFNNEGSLEEYLNEIDLYKYVILDDFGAEKPSEWVIETLYLLVADRYEKEKNLIITSNKSIKELSRSLGDRITSRIVEMCEIIELKGGDKRLK
jgi:DNA replication protein DnaC